jgi:hypothetical protein
LDLWFVIAAPVVVAAFLAWYLWAASKRKRSVKRSGSDDPRDTWDALSAGDDPTNDSR